MELLKRKIDDFLIEWKKNTNRLPLIVKGARQVGKTASILFFAEKSYDNIIYINFALQKKYKSIFDDGFEVDKIIENISFLDTKLLFVPNKTLIFFDELQACPNCATSLKSFKLDGRYDVICSGSLMGINYNEIESNSVGYKEDYEMNSMDFEEFLWAKGFNKDQIEKIFQKMLRIEPLSSLEDNVLSENFKEYLVLGGMPAIVNTFINNKQFSGTLQMQKQIIADYEEDITKYAGGLDKTKIINVYHKISVFLGQDNKKFQMTKVSPGARSREYVGVIDWLEKAGIVNICYSMAVPELPLKGNYNPSMFKIYYKDTGLLIGSLDEEVQDDLRSNKNFNTYKGALYENIVADMLVKQGYSLFFYRNDRGTLEMDFFVRDKNSLIPIEVKANDNSTVSLNNLIKNDKYQDIKYGIKLCNRNIGFNGNFYTFPYYLCFLLKRFLKNIDHK